MLRTRSTSPKHRPPQARLTVEGLESRLTPYALSGNAWIHPELITISFVPDGTTVAPGKTSNLFATFNSHSNTTFRTTWQKEIVRAAQTWAAQSNINLKVVSDNGAAIGSGDYQQGDSGFGDIRIGGYNFGTTTLAQAYSPPPDNGDSFAGDFQFNTGQTFNNGTTYDLYTVALHEFGHAFGLFHGASGSAMYGSYGSVLTALATDDINGIRAVAPWSENGFSSPGYGGARTQDAYDAVASNGTFATAKDITSVINTTAKTALIANMDLTSTTDLDFYKFTVPTGLGGTMNVKLQSTGLSLLAPKVTVYKADQITAIGTASAPANDWDGSTLTYATTQTLTAGQVYYVKVEPQTTASAFGTGKYTLALGFSGTAAPAVSLPNTTTANDPLAEGGGGQAVGLGPEFRVNTYTTDLQGTNDFGAARSVAMAPNGNSVVVWHSQGQDGSYLGVYAQRFDAAGNPLGSEFRVNTYTTNNQQAPVVSMDGNGNFVVVWTSTYQDGSELGVYAQRFDANGVKLGSEFRVANTTSGSQLVPSVAMSSNGSFVVTWANTTTAVTPEWDIYARRFLATGAPAANEFRVNTTTVRRQEAPSVAVDATGNFVIVWQDRDQTAMTGTIRGQRYDSSGTKLGSEFQVNSTTATYHSWPMVAMASNGSFVVTWTLQTSTSIYDRDIHARRFDASGNALGTDFRVNTTTTDMQTKASIGINAGGNFFITWDGSTGVFAQQFTATGAFQGTEFKVNTATLSANASSMGMNSNGDAVIVWQGYGTGDIQGIYAQRFMVSYGGMNPMHAFDPEGHEHDDSDGDNRPSTRTRGVPRSVRVAQPDHGLRDLVDLLQERRQRGNASHGRR